MSNQAFSNYVGLKPFIKHCSRYGVSDGSIKVTPRVSFANSYTWSPGDATTNSVTSLGYGSNTVTVNDSLSNTSSYNYNVGYKVQWTNLDLCTVIGDSLVSSATSNLLGSANSKNTLKAGQDGWVEFPIDKLNGEAYYIGLSDSLSPLMGVAKDIDYGINFNSVDDYLYYYEGGSTAVLYTSPVAGDLMRIERVGNTIYYKLNNVNLKTVTVGGLSAKNLKIKCVIQNADYIGRVGCSFYDTDSTSFNNYVQISRSLVKHSSGVGVNDGFISVSPKVAGVYTYTWLPGSATTSSISSLSNNIYTVTIKDSLANTSTYTCSVGYKAKWTNLSNCFFRNDTIKGTGANNTVYGNAYSKNILSANTNGWIEFVLKAYPANATWLGFTDSTSTSVTTLTEMNYGILIPAFSRTLNYYEGGTTNPFYSYMRIGDVIRIERSGNNILYKVNGTTLRTVTSGTISAKVMKAKVRLQYNNELVNVGCSFAPCTFTMSAGSSQTITCTTPSVTLTGTTNLSGASYTWSPGGITTSTLSVTGAGTYSLFVSNSSGECAGQETVAVIANTVVPIVSAGPDKLVVPSGSVTVGGSPSASGSPSSFTYTWSPDTYLSSAFVANPISTPTSNVTYTLTVTNDYGCTANSRMTVFTMQNEIYAKLSPTLDGGYYIIPSSNKLFFTLDGEYEQTNLVYAVYDNTDHSLVTGLTPSSTTLNYQDNRYYVDVSSLSSNYYLLEVQNQKKEKLYLRFKK